jgi:hypothetical protein
MSTRRKTLSMALIGLLASGICSLGLAQDSAGKTKQGAEGAPPARHYDVFYQVHVPMFADLVVGKIQEVASKELDRRKTGESDEEHANRKQLGEAMTGWVTRAVKELDRLSLGWGLDRQAGQSHLDLTVTALAGTSLAGRFAATSEAKTSFAGFCLPGAALIAHGTGRNLPGEASALAKIVQAARERELKKIDKESISDDEKSVRKDLIGKLFDVARDTAASGRRDFGLSLVLGPKKVTLVSGVYFADAEKLESVFKTLGGFLQASNPVFSSLAMDVEKHQGVSFHTLLVSPPEGDLRGKFVELFGESMEVAIGFGKEAMYVAAGKDAMKSLKDAIQKSATPTKLEMPLEISLALKPVADFLTAMGPDQLKGPAGQVAELLGASGGKDHLRITAKPLPAGVILRLDAEEGLLKVISAVNPQARDFLKLK